MYNTSEWLQELKKEPKFLHSFRERQRSFAKKETELPRHVAFAEPAQGSGSLAVSTWAWRLSCRGVTCWAFGPEWRDLMLWVPTPDLLKIASLLRIQPVRLSLVGHDFRGLFTGKCLSKYGLDACVTEGTSWTFMLAQYYASSILWEVSYIHCISILT